MLSVKGMTNNNTLFRKQIQLIGLYNLYIYYMLIAPTTYFTYIVY